MESPPTLRVRNLTIPLPPGGDRPYAVEDLTLDLRPGEIHCVVGESGSGKSMLAAAAMGLLPRGLAPSRGEILYRDTDLLRLPERTYRGLRGRRLGMIFQEPMSALNPCFRVDDQLREVFVAHGARAEPGRLEAMLSAVRITDTARVLRAYPHQLSGGQRQRVVIAMAMALDPEVLIADEPTTALDVTTQAEVLALIDALRRERGTAVLFVTHDFGVVAEIGDRVSVMRHGRIVEEGSPEDLLSRPSADYTRALVDAIPRPAVASPDPPPASPIVVVEGAVKAYRSRVGLRAVRTVEALKGVSLTVQPGRTLGILGESGSGKSTLARCLVRLEALDGGRIDVDGIAVRRARGSDLTRLRRTVQMVFQDPYASLDGRRDVAAILCEGPVNCGVPRAEALLRARELLDRVGLAASSLGRRPGEFSGGQRQRLCIARAISMRPKVLVADEAVSALDVSVQRQVLDLLAELKRELGLTLVFITHDVRVAAAICDEVAVVHEGRIVEAGRAACVLSEPKHDYTRRLIRAMPGSRLLPHAFSPR